MGSQKPDPPSRLAGSALVTEQIRLVFPRLSGPHCAAEPHCQTAQY